MGERCRNAYRKRGKKAVFCKVIEGDMPLCAHQYMCPNTQRWEVNKAAACTLKSKTLEDKHTKEENKGEK